MTIAAVADLDTERALAACAATGLITLGVLTPSETSPETSGPAFARHEVVGSSGSGMTLSITRPSR
ncbi:MAG: hypothetical protein IZT58_15460 [Actinobacteria bacterium]|nr:hypothetical protein [Actinomycetota bacterium]